MIIIESKDNKKHQLSSTLLSKIKDHIKYKFSKNINTSIFDKIKNILTTKYDEEKTILFLKKLDIFSDIKELSNIFYVKEKKVNISLKSKLNNQNNFENSANLCFPNIYGFGESISFECIPLKGIHLCFKKPIITNKNLSFFELKVFEEIRKSSIKKYNVRGSSISHKTDYFSIGLSNDLFEKKSIFYSFLNYKSDIFNFNINTGINNFSPFIKLISGIKQNWYWNKFYLKSNFQCGIIKGKTHSTNKFSLGGNTIGYKENTINVKNGGKSFFELNNEIGIKFAGINFFLRKNIAFNSKQNKFFNILYDIKKSIPNLKDNIGIGIGIGLSYLYNGHNIGIAYTMPIKGDNRYVLILDAEI